MSLKKSDVEHVSHLARLNISPKQAEKFTNQLADILKYVEKLNELDTDKIAPTDHVLFKENVFREDIVKPWEQTEKILENAPEREGRFFKVKKVIE
ncbi:Asp-tRNA(Asn)/Glu-tRNA(Gln) amidotransferase subunit GatC [bacterium]